MFAWSSRLEEPPRPTTGLTSTGRECPFWVTTCNCWPSPSCMAESHDLSHDRSSFRSGAANAAARCGGVPGRSAFSGSAAPVLKDLPTKGRRKTSASPRGRLNGAFRRRQFHRPERTGIARRGHLPPCPRSATSNGSPWTCVSPPNRPSSGRYQLPSIPAAQPPETPTRTRAQRTQWGQLTTRVAIGTTAQPGGCRGCDSGSRVGQPRAQLPCAASLLPPSTAPALRPAAWGCWSCASLGPEWKRPAATAFRSAPLAAQSRERPG